MNPGILFVQYIAQIVYSTYSLYESPSTDEAEQALIVIAAANTSRTGNTTDDKLRVYAVTESLIEMTTSFSNASLSGTLWLLPASVSRKLCDLLTVLRG